MDSRGNSRNIPPANDECIIQGSGMKLASMADEFTRGNSKLAAGKLAMRQDSTAAKGEADDTRICSLLEKMLKGAAVVRAGDKRKRGSLCEMTSRRNLSIKELEYSRALTNELPQLRAKLDILMKNHQRLCETIKCKIGLNLENVDQMKMLENSLIGITGKVESLCTEVSNAEKRAKALIPQGVPNTSFHGNGGGYADGFDGTHLHGAPMQIMDPYARCGPPVGLPQAISGPVSGADLNLELCL